jgi:hypothetical protein
MQIRPHLHCDLKTSDLTNSDNVIDAEQTSVFPIGYFRGHLGYATPAPSAELILATLPLGHEERNFHDNCTYRPTGLRGTR